MKKKKKKSSIIWDCSNPGELRGLNINSFIVDEIPDLHTANQDWRDSYIKGNWNISNKQKDFFAQKDPAFNGSVTGRWSSSKLKDSPNYTVQSQNMANTNNFGFPKLPKFNVKNRTPISKDPYLAYDEALRLGKDPNKAAHEAMFKGMKNYDELGIDEFKNIFGNKIHPKPEEFKPPFSELIEHSIQNTNPTDVFSWKGFSFDYQSRIKRVYTEDEIKSMAPKLKLVQIGMDFPLGINQTLHIPIKWLSAQSWDSFNQTIKKNQFYVLAYYEKRDQPFELFEFPTHNLIKPKSDYVLYLDPYGPSETDIELTEVYLHIKGIKVIKKYDIKQAHELLIKRKNLFLSAPTATNTILLFQLMDAIILNEFKQGTLDLDASREKTLTRLEKLKNLAAGTKFNEERKLAVENCFTQFDKLIVKVEEVKG
jgi:hypothetical protein